MSEKWKSGPVANHTNTATAATIVAIDEPLIRATASVKRTKVLERFLALFRLHESGCPIRGA